jgi:hypothetical protein
MSWFAISTLSTLDLYAGGVIIEEVFAFLLSLGASSMQELKPELCPLFFVLVLLVRGTPIVL